ncbi:MAG: hypothetical protein CVU39_22745 [Chloroflexi bacterium HGW-Chloroflexi-10]|nr:MAG: hypothetical protein CVU39_22745 [Chloroflexi bacterium HGW-Chloroflexi-10]
MKEVLMSVQSKSPEPSGRERPRVLVGAFLLITLLLLISASLSDLQFEQPQPLPNVGRASVTQEALQTDLPAQEIPASVFMFLPAVQGFLGLVLIGVILSFLVSWIAHVPIKKLLLYVLFIGLLALGLALLPQFIPEQLPTDSIGAGELSNLPPETVSLPSELGDPSQQFIWLVFGGVLLLAATTAFLLYRQRLRLQPAEETSLLQEAQSALDAFSAGQEFSEVIGRCYLQMCRVVQRESGIERQQDITPNEFQDSLIQKGFPSEPVLQLTRLFEMVRYGGQELTLAQEQTGVEALQAVMQYCQGHSVQ